MYHPSNVPELPRSLYARDEQLAVIELWFKHIDQRRPFIDRVKKGELENLPESDRKFVLNYAIRAELLRYFIEELNNVFSPEPAGWLDFLTKLKNAGFDINATDHDGRTPLSYCTKAKVYMELKGLGAELIYPNETELNLLMTLQNFNASPLWLTLLKEVMTLATRNDLKSLNQENLSRLLDLIKPRANDPQQQIRADFAKAFWELFDSWQKANPIDAAKFLFVEESRLRTEELLKLVGQNRLTGPVIEFIFTHTKGLTYLYGDEDLEKCVAPLRKRGAYSLTLHFFMQRFTTMKAALWSAALLRASTLNDIARLLSHIKAYMGEAAGIDQGIKDIFHAHIKRIEVAENSNLWFHFAGCYIDDSRLKDLLEFGLVPNACNRYGRNLLFTQLIQARLSPAVLEKYPIKLDQRDAFGHNALEHHILHADDLLNFCIASTAIMNLINLGIRVSQKLPYFEFCQQEFPEDLFKQALLAYLLNNRNFKSAYDNLYNHDDIRKAAKKVPVLGQRIEVANISYEKRKGWESFYPAQIVAQLGSMKCHLLFVLPQFWGGQVPLEAFQKVSENITVSLFCVLLERVPAVDIQVLEDLMSQLIFTHDGAFYLISYLASNPKTFGIFVNQFCRASKLRLCKSGMLVANYSRITQILLHAASDKARKVLITYQISSKHFSPRDCLWIPPAAAVHFTNNSILVSMGGDTEVYKIMPHDQSFRSFSVEMRNLSLLMQQAASYQSRLPSSLGSHVYKEVSGRLKDKLGNEPVFAYQYKCKVAEEADLFSLPQETFQIAQERWQSDYGKMVANGNAPRLLPSSTRDLFWREYKVLSSLRNFINYSMNRMTFAIGKHNPSTSIPAAFDAMDKLEINAGGLSNPGNWLEADFMDTTNGCQFYNDMECLSRGVYINAIIHLKWLRAHGVPVQWTNGEQIQFVRDGIMNGFARICSSYAGSDLEALKKIIVDSGFDPNRMAAQVLFWADVTDNGYMAWLKQGRLPEGLYDADIEVEIDLVTLKEYIAGNKFEIDGKECLGIPFGPLCWVDLDRLTHALTLLAVIRADGLKPPASPSRAAPYLWSELDY